jgi:ABC-type Fe3+/spermidine/putrescine transport system ATPase subunit
MDHGRVVQTGTPREVYRLPRDEIVARFIGEMGFLPATVAGQADGFAVLDTPAGRMRARPSGGAPVVNGAACYLGIRPEDFELQSNGHAAAGNVVEGEVVQARFVGEATIYAVRVGGAVLGFKARHGIEFAIGDRVRLAAAAEHCVAVSPAATRDAYDAREEIGPRHAL